MIRTVVEACLLIGINPAFADKVEMDVDVENNQYDLIVTTVDETDAGTYVAGFLVLQDKQEAQLVILGWCSKFVFSLVRLCTTALFIPR